MDSPEVELRRLSEALREAIRQAKISQRQVERTLGQGKGYLSQLLGGTVDLKLKHLFAVLAVLRIEPADFFLKLYGRSDPGRTREVWQEIEELKRRVARLEHEAVSEHEP